MYVCIHIFIYIFFYLNNILFLNIYIDSQMSEKENLYMYVSLVF